MFEPEDEFGGIFSTKKKRYIVGLCLVGAFIILSWWTSHSIKELSSGCVETNCTYQQILTKPTGCKVTAKFNKTYSCLQKGNSCPFNPKYRCFIIDDNTCPFIGSCINPLYSTQFVIAVVFLTIVSVLSCILLIYCRKDQSKRTSSAEHRGSYEII